MAQWYVKELSRLTQVSVQTLHHYDRIGLLKPSVRLANGYRLYSEKDLLTLQQIMALKFFGFELAQIKTLLTPDINVLDHFSAQSHFLEARANQFLTASATLKTIISEYQLNESIPWESIIKLIEAYRMTQQLEKTWAGKALSAEELKIYAAFERDLQTRFTAEQEKKCKKEWHDLVSDIHDNLKKDPASPVGIELGRRCMEWVNNLYGKKYVSLRNTIWKKGFKEGHAAEEHGLTPEAVIWLENAMSAYYRDRIYKTLNQINSAPSKAIVHSWDELLLEMCGDDQLERKSIIDAALKDDKVNQAAKNWLQQSK